MNKLCPALIALPLLAGCTSAASPARFMASDAYKSRQEITRSLFPSDQAVLNNEAIEKILSSKISLPPDGRIAVLDFGQRGAWHWWSTDLARLGTEAVRRLLDRLRSCDHVADASVLPSLLMPERRTVPYLREAAARYQADLLLVYRTASHTYRKDRFLAPDQVRAYCLVEAVLLDTRTGIVPFTTVATQRYTAEKSKKDFDTYETERKAELQALRDALENVGRDVAAFLDAAVDEEPAQRPVKQETAAEPVPTSDGGRYRTTGGE